MGIYQGSNSAILTERIDDGIGIDKQLARVSPLQHMAVCKLNVQQQP